MFIFKRAIKKNISTDEAEEILKKLNSFLDENSPQLTYWLAKIFKDQQNSISYAELEKAAASGFENEIRKWQEDYAKFVNEKLNPLWIFAIQQGAKHFSEKHKNIFYDNDRFVKDWLNKHAAEFITNINAETRQAIKSILAYGQDNGMSVKELAKIIRPTIGLNQRQAAANLNYRNSVKEKLLQNNPRMSQAKAEQKAQAAALKYASKQHRQRAEMIAHTELAFAYNRGAHESVRQAMSNGLMGRCEKVWTTAGTNRVCGRCMDFSGTVVGFEDKFFNSSVTDGQTPPLHPRCRCVIVYREIDAPRGKNTLQINEINGNMLAGAFAGALNPNSREAVEHAIRYYGLVRSMKTDCARIAKNTGFRVEDIQRIKNHVFYQKHELEDGLSTFDPDYEMGQSWQRLIEGSNIEKRDIVLLNHEFLESIYMEDGYKYDEAHEKAQNVYSYAAALREVGR